MAEISNEKRKFSLALAKAPVSALETGVCERSGADVSAKLIDGHTQRTSLPLGVLTR